MPFGIPSEDFHGGFGIPEDEVHAIYCGVTDDDLTDEEYAAIAEEANDNTIRALIEAGGEIDSLENDKRRLIYSLNETVKWLNYFLTHNRDDVYYDEASEARCRAEYLLMDLEGME